jgi:hypothetical protein
MVVLTAILPFRLTDEGSQVRTCCAMTETNPLQSITVRAFTPLAGKIPVSRETVAATDRGFSLVT